MSTVLYEPKGAVVRITLNRPQAMNAFDLPTARELGRRLEEFDSDDALRVAIVTGAGDKAFCAGADLKQMHGGSHAGGIGELWGSEIQYRLGQRLQVAKPVIAAINGYCLAGGLELALGCDIRIASETASFGCPEVRWAILHGFGAMRLPQHGADVGGDGDAAHRRAHRRGAREGDRAGEPRGAARGSSWPPRSRSRSGSGRTGRSRSSSPRSWRGGRCTSTRTTRSASTARSPRSSTRRKTPRRGRARSPRSARPASRGNERRMTRHPLDSFANPASVAVIGASTVSTRRGGVGGAAWSRRVPGPALPDPSHRDRDPRPQGVPVARSRCRRRRELAVVLVRPDLVPGALEECAQLACPRWWSSPPASARPGPRARRWSRRWPGACARPAGA